MPFYSMACLTSHPIYSTAALCNLWITHLPLTSSFNRSIIHSTLCILYYTFSPLVCRKSIISSLVLPLFFTLSRLSLPESTLTHLHAHCHSPDHCLACSRNSFADKVVKNAEGSPLECWECDSWSPRTSRQPQQCDCFQQWIQTRWPIHDKEELPTRVLYLHMAVGQRYCMFNLIGLEKTSLRNVVFYSCVFWGYYVWQWTVECVCVCVCVGGGIWETFKKDCVRGRGTLRKECGRKLKCRL